MLKNSSILFKDNMLKCGWNGNEQCHFCSAKETLDHLFFQFVLAKLILQIVLCAYGLNRSPDRTVDLFGRWLSSFPAGQRKFFFFFFYIKLGNASW